MSLHQNNNQGYVGEAVTWFINSDSCKCCKRFSHGNYLSIRPLNLISVCPTYCSWASHELLKNVCSCLPGKQKNFCCGLGGAWQIRRDRDDAVPAQSQAAFLCQSYSPPHTQAHCNLGASRLVISTSMERQDALCEISGISVLNRSLSLSPWVALKLHIQQ